MIHKLVGLFRQPSAEAAARRELEECRRNLLYSERMRDYYAKMAEYNEARIIRLRVRTPQT